MATSEGWGRTGYRRNLVNYPWFIDAKSGEIVISERDGHRLQFFNSFGGECRFNPFGERGSCDNQFLSPGGVTTTNRPGAQVVVADTGNRRVCYYNIYCDQHGYGRLRQTHTFGHLVFSEPMGVEYDAARDILVVADFGKGRVTFHDMDKGAIIGECQKTAETPLISPVDIAIDDSSHVYVSDPGAGLISCFDRDGSPFFSFGFGELSKPWGVCFDRSMNLLVSDEDMGRVLMYNRQGQVVREVAKGLYRPKGVSVTKCGDLVVCTADPYNFLKIMKY